MLIKIKEQKNNKTVVRSSNSDDTMATISLRSQSSISLEELSLEIDIDSEKLSDHWQPPLRTDTLLDFAIVLPFSTETTETNSLSHPLGTYKHLNQHSFLTEPEFLLWPYTETTLENSKHFYMEFWKEIFSTIHELLECYKL